MGADKEPFDMKTLESSASESTGTIGLSVRTAFLKVCNYSSMFL